MYISHVLYVYKYLLFNKKYNMLYGIKSYKGPNYDMFSIVLSLPLFYFQIFFTSPFF
jgi:hypothetical protein